MTSLCFVEKDIHSAFDKLTTYMRGGMREITMDALEEKTVQAVTRALKTKNE